MKALLFDNIVPTRRGAPSVKCRARAWKILNCQSKSSGLSAAALITDVTRMSLLMANTYRCAPPPLPRSSDAPRTRVVYSCAARDRTSNANIGSKHASCEFVHVSHVGVEWSEGQRKQLTVIRSLTCFKTDQEICERLHAVYKICEY